MAKIKSIKEIATDFKSSMQKIADEGALTISVSVGNGEYHTIAEPKNKPLNSIQMEKQFVDYEIKYLFTEDEKLELSQQLARSVAEKLKLDDRKKTAMAEFKSLIQEKEEETRDIAIKVTNGYDYRTISAEMVRDEENKCFNVTNPETSEILKIIPFKPEDLQTKMQLDEEQSDASIPAQTIAEGLGGKAASQSGPESTASEDSPV